jgi:hypothetical protein
MRKEGPSLGNSNRKYYSSLQIKVSIEMEQFFCFLYFSYKISAFKISRWRSCVKLVDSGAAFAHDKKRPESRSKKIKKRRRSITEAMVKG